MLKRIGRKIARKFIFRAGKRAVAAPSTKPVKPEPKSLRLSLVVPTYNVEAYIDRFLESVFTQTSHLRSFEVIIVDDGSTDRTAEIVRGWQARHPKHLRYVHQENAGASAARNTGLGLAKGTWIFFPDPDDFLDKNYVRRMLKETEQEHEQPLLAVCSNMIFYFEDRDEYSDSHPLRYKFRQGKVRKSSHDLGSFIHLSGATVWLHRETVIKSGIRFDMRVKPSFEDAHFINRLFLASPNRTVSFVPEAKYYYRKRLNKTSQVDTAKTKNSWFIDKLKHGILDLLENSTRTVGHVPNYIQRTCLYEVFWSFRYLVDHEERAEFLEDATRAEFLSLIRAVFGYIDVRTINGFELAGCTEEHKVSLLAMFKDQRRESTAVYLQQIDRASGRMQFSYFSGGNDRLAVRPIVNGQEAKMCMPSQRSSTFMSAPYFTQHFFWVTLDDGDTISFDAAGAPCRIRRGGRAIGHEADWLTLRNALVQTAPRDVCPEHRRLREFVVESQDKYRDCWVLMDRDDRADDNAEHLYRHLMRQGRDGNVWFILSRESRDWDRLEKEGFKLLAFGSDDHIAAQMNASVLASSHADHYVLWPVPKAEFGDLARYKFVFLQHGVTTNDLSAWLNKKPIRLFVTSTPAEAVSISDTDSSYVFSSREVILSGFPRHDALLKKSIGLSQDRILLIPTWRKYLTLEGEVSGKRRLRYDGFFESKFFNNWSALINSEKLRKIAGYHGLKIDFVPHPNITIYLDDMNFPDWVNVVDVSKGMPYQDIFSKSRVAITDLSSAVSEVAYLQRPVIYFQFDIEEVFKGGHVYKKGYFSFERDGFGPVAKHPDDVVARLDDALSGREDPAYAARRDAAFPFRDGGCCERVRVAIEQLSRSRPALAPDYATRASLPALSKASGERSAALKLASGSAF